MKKKLLKYGKILMALTLIGALSLPSYATVGAADGSAFVTKAEFDAALADFNARLTTFEAGINSKIDSQVSSYLDRNGIWNGKKQTIVTTYLNIEGLGATMSMSGYCNSSTNGSSTAAGESLSSFTLNACYNMLSVHGHYTSSVWPTIIASINKSGLLKIEFSHDGTSVDCVGRLKFNWFLGSSQELQFRQEAGKIIYTQAFRGWVVDGFYGANSWRTCGISYYGCWYLPPISGTIYCFVTKGKPLQVNVLNKASGDAGSFGCAETGFYKNFNWSNAWVY